MEGKFGRSRSGKCLKKGERHLESEEYKEEEEVMRDEGCEIKEMVKRKR